MEANLLDAARMAEGILASIVAGGRDDLASHHATLQRAIRRIDDANHFPVVLDSMLAVLAGTPTAKQAQSVMYDCQWAAGWHMLITLAVEDCVDDLIQNFGTDLPQLRKYVEQGCAYVGENYECHSDEYAEQRTWALEKAKEFAADEGVAWPDLVE